MAKSTNSEQVASQASNTEGRSVEELLDAATEAPTFGLNARELILQAARQISEASFRTQATLHTRSTLQPMSLRDDCYLALNTPLASLATQSLLRVIALQKSATSARADTSAKEVKATRELLSSLYKLGPSLLQALPNTERPLVPFKAIHSSKIPRVNRQVVLDRLTGQHLGLLLNTLGMPIIGRSLAAIPEQRQEAIKAAVAQEEDVYKRGKASKPVYLNYAARANAALWLEKGQARDLEAPKAEQLSISHEDAPGSPTERQHGLERAKRRKQDEGGLIEVDINWEEAPSTNLASPETKATEEDTGTLRVNQAEPGPPSAATPVSEIGKPALEAPQPLQGSHQPEAGQKIRAANSHSGSQTLQAQPSAEGLEEYSPSRHGGESPPREIMKPAQAEKPQGGPAAENMVLNALIKFLKAQLDPLYEAKGISRLVYKRAMHKTVEKVMRSQATEASPKFLMKEGSKINALLVQYVERESEREKVLIEAQKGQRTGAANSE